MEDITCPNRMEILHLDPNDLDEKPFALATHYTNIITNRNSGIFSIPKAGPDPGFRKREAGPN